MRDDDFDFQEEQSPDAPFHIEVDLYETGDYTRLLECWEQEDGHLDEEIVQLIGAAIQAYGPD